MQSETAETPDQPRQLEPGAFHELLLTVVRTLGAERWAPVDLDRQLRERICSALEVIKGDAIIVYLSGFDMQLCCFKPSSGTDGATRKEAADAVQRQVMEQRARLVQGDTVVCDCAAGSRAVITLFGRLTIPGLPTDQCDYCAFVCRPSRGLLGRVLQEERVVHARALATLFLEAIRWRANLFGHFPIRLSRRYWDDSDPVRSGTKRLRPPWEIGRPVRTATLAFDLRKSTFCMAEASDPRAFAIWLDQLVQTLRRVGDLHGGVFDKFTGDGVLVHFPEDECRDEFNCQPVTAATKCAVDMLAAFRPHLERLRGIVHNTSALVGGGVGIDIMDGHWSVDHMANPMIVGRGVVGACRLSDQAKAGEIRLTNIAYHDLITDPDIPSPDKTTFRANEVPSSSKDYAPELKVQVWRFYEPPRVLGSPAADIEALYRSVVAP